MLWLVNADSIAYRFPGASSCKLRSCSPGDLPVGSRPFLVDGIVAVWLGVDYLLPSDLQIRDYGHGIAYEIDTHLPANPRQDKKNATWHLQGSPSERALRFASLYRFTLGKESMQKAPKPLGNNEESIKFYQAESLSTNVVSRVGSSDIGLDKLKDGIKFDNTFFWKSIQPQRVYYCSRPQSSIISSRSTISSLMLAPNCNRDSSRVSTHLSWISDGQPRRRPGHLRYQHHVNEWQVADPMWVMRLSVSSSLYSLETAKTWLPKGQIGAFVRWPNVRSMFKWAMVLH